MFIPGGVTSRRNSAKISPWAPGFIKQGCFFFFLIWGGYNYRSINRFVTWEYLCYFHFLKTVSKHGDAISMLNRLKILYYLGQSGSKTEVIRLGYIVNVEPVRFADWIPAWRKKSAMAAKFLAQESWKDGNINRRDEGRFPIEMISRGKRCLVVNEKEISNWQLKRERFKLVIRHPSW